MKKHLAVLLAFLLSATFSIAQKKESKTKEVKLEVSEELKTFGKEDYQFQYPASWELMTEGLNGVECYVLSPMSSESDPFRENVNVLIQDLSSEPIDLARYVEISESQIPELIPEGKILESDTKKGSVGSFHRIVFSGMQGEYDLKFLQYYLIKDQKAYVLTLTALQSDYSDFVAVGEKVLSSFRFKK